MDVAVVGAGIVGVTTTALLARSGARVALLEAGRIVEGVTGHTTAKVTSLHTLVYDRLIRERGREQAACYGAANEAAIGLIRQLCAEEGVECELAEETAYTYAISEDDLRRVTAEAEAARSLDLPASLRSPAPLPFENRGAVAFDGQASFHPRKYLLGLADGAAARGAAVFERTRAVGVEGRGPCRVLTEGGPRVSAGHVVVATNLPFLDRSLLFARTKPVRAYAVAMEAGSEVPRGMFIGAGAVGHSVRVASYEGSDVLVISGAGHPVGEGESLADRWGALAGWGKDALGAGEVRFFWSTQDYSSLDGVPFVGALSPGGSDRVLGATGFGGWGMTGGTAAAIVLADRVSGTDNPWASVFSPARLRGGLVEAVKKGARDAGRLVGGKIGSRPRADAIAIAPGEADVVRSGGRLVAVHRDAEGALHAVDAACAHLGCTVAWNDAERSWDCPCHGSRFTPDGAVLAGPATRPLAKRSVAVGQSVSISA